MLSAQLHAVAGYAAAAPVIERTLAWSAINSGSDNLAGLGAMADVLADSFSVLPGQLKLVEAAPANIVEADGRISERQYGRNLHLRVRPEAPLQLLLTGHMDTVFGTEHPFQKPCMSEDGTILHGPGVADMKGGIAVMLAALTAVEAAGCSTSLGYELVINSDEEVGSPGSRLLIEAAAKGKYAAFTYEPALPDGHLVCSRPGSGNFSVIFRGRSAHAGRNPQDGRNAILAAADYALALVDRLQPRFPVNPSRIDGGGPTNVVPDLAILRVNMRPKSTADMLHAQIVLDELGKTLAQRHNLEVSCSGSFNRPPKPLDVPTQRLLDLVKTSAAELEFNIGWRDAGGVCDGNNIAALGVPVIDTMGVVGGNIHSAEEYACVDSFAQRAALSAVVIQKIINGASI